MKGHLCSFTQFCYNVSNYILGGGAPSQTEPDGWCWKHWSRKHPWISTTPKGLGRKTQALCFWLGVEKFLNIEQGQSTQSFIGNGTYNFIFERVLQKNIRTIWYTEDAAKVPLTFAENCLPEQMKLEQFWFQLAAEGRFNTPLLKIKQKRWDFASYLNLRGR